MATMWGIVGTGRIAHDFTTVLRSLPNDEHKIMAVVDIDIERAENFAELHQISNAYGNFEEFSKDENIEIVHVGLLNPYHFEVGKIMLEHGKNVLMEKPMCMNFKQTQKLITIAKKNGLFLMEGIWTRFFPAINVLYDELSRKTIGDVVHVQLTHGISSQNAERISKKSLGGGGILDLGAYAANVLMSIFQEEPLQIKTVGTLNSEGVDQCLASSLLFSNNRTAHVTISTCFNLPNELEIIGTKGNIKIPNGPYHCPTKIITPEKVHYFPLPDTILPCNYVNSSGFRYEANAVRECLKKGLKECPQMTHRDSEINARIRDFWKCELGVIFPADEE